MFRKKSNMAILNTYAKRMDKKAMKLTKKFLKDTVSSKSKIYRALVKWPRRMEIIVSIVFIVTVFFMFYKKAKNPDFLSNIGQF